MLPEIEKHDSYKAHIWPAFSQCSLGSAECLGVRSILICRERSNAHVMEMRLFKLNKCRDCVIRICDRMKLSRWDVFSLTLMCVSRMTYTVPVYVPARDPIYTVTLEGLILNLPLSYFGWQLGASRRRVIGKLLGSFGEMGPTDKPFLPFLAAYVVAVISVKSIEKVTLRWRRNLTEK